MSTPDSADYDAPEQECGFAFDHDEVVTYDGPDGIQWYCRRCGGEGFTEPESTPDGYDAVPDPATGRWLVKQHGTTTSMTAAEFAAFKESVTAPAETEDSSEG